MSQDNEIPPEEKISIKKKACFSIGYLGTNAVSGVFASSLIIFYREELLLSEMYIFWAFILYMAWNAINDPLFGWLSDRTSTKRGRRIPFLIVCAPILAISFFFIWISPTKLELGEFGVFLWMIMTMLLYDTVYTAALIPYQSLSQEISMDHRERASIQVFVMIFGLIGVLLSLFLPMSFLDAPGREGFIWMAIIIALSQLVTMWIVAFTIKERLEFSHVDSPFGFIDSIKHTFKSRAFLITVTMNFCIVFVNSALLGNLFFYIFYGFQGIDETLVIILILLAILSGIGVGIYYLLKLNKIKGLKTALFQSLIFLGCGLILVGLLPGFIALIGFFIVGVGFFGTLALINTAFGEVADEDEVKTGIRREAAIFGANALITKPAQSVAGSFIAIMLLYFNYQEPIFEIRQWQSPFTILGLRLAIGIIPGLVILLAALIFSFYPLKGEYLKDIKTKMNLMHQEKKEKFHKKFE